MPARKRQSKTEIIPPPAEPEKMALACERRRVAQALHDTTCQELTGIYLQACGAARKFRALSPEAEQKFDEIAEKIRGASIRLGEFMNTLRSDETAKTSSGTHEGL